MSPYTIRITTLAVALVTLTAGPSFAQRRQGGGDRGGDRNGGSVQRAEPRARQAPPARVAPSDRDSRRYVAPNRQYVPNRQYNNRSYTYRPYNYYGSRSYVYPYRPYRYSYAVPFGYRPYGYRPGWSLNLYFGRPYGYAYPGYGYGPAYGYYSVVPGRLYGAVRIVDAPRDAQVFVDGYYAGVVDDYDGVFQHLNLEPGEHRIEIEAPGWPPTGFDVRVVPGETITYHARP